MTRTIVFRGLLIAVFTRLFFFTTAAATALAAQKTHQFKIRYVPPKNPELQPVYEAVKQRHSLEKLQNFLSPFRLPEKLRISFDDCDGEPDAFYENNAITICYEYVDELWKNMPEETTPSGIAPADTVIGPLFEVALHELGHALFEMLILPHIDVALVEEIRGGSWLCTGENDDPSKKCSMFDPDI